MVSCGTGVHWKCVSCAHIIIHSSIHPSIHPSILRHMGGAGGGGLVSWWMLVHSAVKMTKLQKELLYIKLKVQCTATWERLAEVQSTIYPLEHIYVKSSRARSLYTFSLFQRDWLSLWVGKLSPVPPPNNLFWIPTIVGQLVIFGPLALLSLVTPFTLE
jgi:hypothetical protein